MNNEQQPAIAVQNLRKIFGSQTVLNGINFRVGRGETVAVVGRSGGGKSVLLKLLIRLLVPDSGSIRIANEEISKLLIIWLLQQAPTDSVEACPDPPSRRRCASFSPTLPQRKPASGIWPLVVGLMGSFVRDAGMEKPMSC